MDPGQWIESWYFDICVGGKAVVWLVARIAEAPSTPMGSALVDRSSVFRVCHRYEIEDGFYVKALECIACEVSC
jgi:hypothetical protein